MDKTTVPKLQWTDLVMCDLLNLIMFSTQYAHCFRDHGVSTSRLLHDICIYTNKSRYAGARNYETEFHEKCDFQNKGGGGGGGGNRSAKVKPTFIIYYRYHSRLSVIQIPISRCMKDDFKGFIVFQKSVIYN